MSRFRAALGMLAAVLICIPLAGCDLLCALTGTCPPRSTTPGGSSRSAQVAQPAQGVEGGPVPNLNAVSSFGCNDAVPGAAPPADGVASIQGGTAWVSGGQAGTGQGWAGVSPGALGFQGSVFRALGCSGTRLYAATDKGLEWISTLDRSTGVFRFASDVAVFHGLSGGKVLAATVIGRVLLCDEATNACSPEPDLDPTPAQALGFAELPQGGLFFLTSRRLYTSPNGTSWTPETSVPVANYSRLSLVGGDAFVVGSGTSGLLRSAGGRAPFSQIAPTNYNESVHEIQTVPVVGVAASGGSLHALGSAPPRLWTSTNGGSSWSPGTTLPGVYGTALAATPGFLWASTEADTLRSADRGGTWQAYNTGLTNLGLSAVGASGANAAAAGPLAGVFTSRDGCRTFTKAANLPFADSITVVLVRADSTIFAGGSYLQRSTDGGATWARMNLPVTNLRALLDSGGALWASGTGIGVYRSVDGGVNWVKAGTGQPAGLLYGDLATNGSALAVTYGLTVARSTDGGSTWTTGSAIPGASSVSGLAFLGNTLFAAINQGTPGIHRSTDLGTTWTKLGGGLPSGVGMATIQNLAGTLYASGARYFTSSFNGAWKSTDGGETWASASSELDSMNVAGFAASSTGVCVGTSANSVLFLPAIATVRRLVPVALDVDTGATRYTTELSVTNRGSSDASMSLQYTASLGSGTGTVRNVLVRAGQQWVQADIVGFLRQQGLAIPAGAQQAGTLLVTLENLSGNDVAGVVARTTAATLPPQPAGAAGLAYGGVDPARAATTSSTVYGLRTTAADRTNLAVYNASPDPLTFRVEVFDGSGTGAHTIVAAADTLPPWGWIQYNRVLGATGFTNGWATVTRTSAAGAFGVYAVINDNVTNDGSFIVAAPSEPRPLYLNVPVLVETSSFVSELVLANASAKPATFQIRYREALSPGAPGNTGILIHIPAGTQQIIPNAIDWLRSQNFAIGAPGSSYAGELNVTMTSGGGVGELYAGARTASPSAAGGQYGLFTGAAFAGDEATTVAYVYGLHADANNRSNVAALNTAQEAASGSITLSLEVFDGDHGGISAGATTLVLAPGQWAQASGILANAGVSNGWVRVTRTAGTAPWVAYGVVNDGGQPGQRTGDGAYVPMERP
ncbi:MAG: sialidase family protein [Acidobacteriota bacterium]